VIETMYCVLVGLSFWSTASPTIQTLDDVITLGLDTEKGDVQVKRGDKEPISITDLYNSIEYLKTTVSQQSTLIAGMKTCAKKGQAYDESIDGCISVCQQLTQCDGVSCNDNTRGAQRMGEKAPEFCADSGWTELGGAHKGSTAQNPATDCSDAEDGGKSVSGWFYIKEGANSATRRRWCTFGEAGGARDDGGDGTTQDNPIQSCNWMIVTRKERPGVYFKVGSSNPVTCLIGGGESEPGLDPLNPAETCAGMSGKRFVTFGTDNVWEVMCDEPPVRSRSDCKSDLAGWFTKTSYQGDPKKVCAESDVSSSKSCPPSQDHATALDTCDFWGARLCTLDELKGDYARGTGCGYDNNAVHTSTPCLINEKLGHMVTRGRYNNNQYTACLPAGQTAKVRCCADI